MALKQGKWIKLNEGETRLGARSSHAMAVVGNKVYVIGGESAFTVPVDDKLYVYDLDSQTWSVAHATGEHPQSRVGSTMAVVGETIYMFAGRIATAKEPNDREFYAYDTRAKNWTLLTKGDASPPFRTYSSIAADDRYVYVFGGVGAGPRLKDLWAYDTVDGKWSQLPSPGDDCLIRGGPGLAYASGKVWVVYGFTGYPLDDVHCFDPATMKWTKVETSGDKPAARSVFATAAVGKYIIMYSGELKHFGMDHSLAGIYASDSYCLDTETLVWSKFDDGGEADVYPGKRGWCAFATGSFGGNPGLVVHGGNSPSNNRLDDIAFFAPHLA